MAELDEKTRAVLQYHWPFWARPNQLPPEGDWFVWLLLAGRGFGKTRTAVEWVRSLVQNHSVPIRIALVAETAADARDVIVEGESGILACSPAWDRPQYEPSKRRLTWRNGSIATTYSADDPEQLRGPQHHFAWCDELAKYQYAEDLWSNLIFGLRLGNRPKVCITTTPRPIKLIKSLVSDPHTVVTRGSTLENRTNLADSAVEQMINRYAGTRLGRQELEGEILEDIPGALWRRSDVDAQRTHFLGSPAPSIIKNTLAAPASSSGLENRIEDMGLMRRIAEAILKAVPEDLTRIVVAVDPNVSNDEGSDEIGIVVAGRGISGMGYVLADLSMKGSPNEWATTAIIAHDLFKADRIIGEANQGGNMVEHTLKMASRDLKDKGIRPTDFVGITLVHASRGKVTRAEPVAALYEQHRISHIGTLITLEDQMCLFTSDFDRKSMGYSPDRVDALVWALTHLFLENNNTGLLDFYQQEVQKKISQKQEQAVPTALVVMKAPKGISTAYGITGQKYSAQKGLVSVLPDDVKGLRRAGFVEVSLN